MFSIVVQNQMIQQQLGDAGVLLWLLDSKMSQQEEEDEVVHMSSSFRRQDIPDDGHRDRGAWHSFGVVVVHLDQDG